MRRHASELQAAQAVSEASEQAAQLQRQIETLEASHARQRAEERTRGEAAAKRGSSTMRCANH